MVIAPLHCLSVFVILAQQLHTVRKERKIIRKLVALNSAN